MSNDQENEQIVENPILLVQDSYDKIALTYLEWSTHSITRATPLHKLLGNLSKQSKVLELGCGAGKPYTQELVKHSQVTASDISAAQIALARKHVPAAEFIHMDMMSLTFSCGTFDAVVGLYSIIHLPRLDQEVLIKRIRDWLHPGGYFLANLGTTDNPGNTEDWLGSKMYWSSYDVPTNLQIVQRAGLEIVEAETLFDDEEGKSVPFLWILAQKRG